MVPAARIVFTWRSGSLDHSKVTIDLEATDGGTELRLTHEFVPTAEERAAHQGGWIGCLDNLESSLTA